MIRRHYEVYDLDCANCAQKVEDAVASLPGVREAHLNFMTRALDVTVEEGSEENLEDRIRKAIDRTEPDAYLVVPGEDGHAQERHEHEHHEHAHHSHEHEHDEHEHEHDEHEHHHDKEEGSDAKRYVFIALAVVCFAAGLIMSRMGAAVWVQALVFAAATILGGYETMIKGCKNLTRLNSDETLLMTIAVIAAFALKEFPEAAGVAILFTIGELLEDKAVDRSREQIEALANIRAEEAELLGEDEESRTVPADTVHIGDRILIAPFERIPLDGIVEEGESALDTSALTGESIPQTAGPGSEVMSGMVNGDSVLKVRVTHEFEDSAASRILSMVQESASRKGQSERFITRFARIYTPVVVIGAVLLMAIPPLLGLGAFSEWLHRALVFMVASCPCALVISVPLGFFAGIGAASRKGILVKGGKYVELLAEASIAAFDKTGTLTKGSLKVAQTLPLGDASESSGDLLALAAAAERFSAHPMAKAICEAAGSEIEAAEDIRERPGHGVMAVVNGREVSVGSRRMLEDMGIPTDALPDAQVYMTVNGRPAAAFRMQDAVREDVPELISGLISLGVRRCVMLTGDSARAAEETAVETGISDYYAELLPEQKGERMKDLSREGKVFFVGDGINDAPVLAEADVGVAMGLGSDAAIETADIVLVDSRPSRLLDAIRLFRRVMGVVRFNIAFALTVKALVLVLAVFGLAPMWAAVLADTGVALAAVLISVRLLRA
jgi:Cd2+/Zn2+-exporting ATPase